MFLTALFISVSVSAIRSVDSVALYKAFKKAKKVNSMENNTHIILRVSGENMTEKEKEDFESLLPILSMVKLSLNTNSVESNKSNGIKIQSDINAKFKAMSVYSKIWINNDFTEKEPKLEAVISRPSLFNIIELNSDSSKKYIRMDFNKMKGKSNMILPDYRKVLNPNSYSQADFFNFIIKYIKEADVSSNKIEKTTIEGIPKDNSEEHIDIYNIQLDDKVTKLILNDIIGNLKKDKDTIEFVKKFRDSLTSLPRLKIDDENEDKKEFYKAVNVIHDNIWLYSDIISNILDNIDILNINEKRGIQLRCGIDSKGYLVSESINLKLKIDLSSMKKNPIIDNEGRKYTGTYIINLEFTNKLNSINKSKKIDFPVLNEENSIDYFRMSK